MCWNAELLYEHVPYRAADETCGPSSLTPPPLSTPIAVAKSVSNFSCTGTGIQKAKGTLCDGHRYHSSYITVLYCTVLCRVNATLTPAPGCGKHPHKSPAIESFPAFATMAAEDEMDDFLPSEPLFDEEDGWSNHEDDLDLDDDDDNKDTITTTATTGAGAVVSLPLVSQTETGAVARGCGWDDDDDALFGDGLSETKSSRIRQQQPPPPTHPTALPQPSHTGVVATSVARDAARAKTAPGGADDDVGRRSFPVMKNPAAPVETKYHASGSVERKRESTDAVGCWEEDDDLEVSESNHGNEKVPDRSANTTTSAAPFSAPASKAEGWDDESEGLDFSDYHSEEGSTMATAANTVATLPGSDPPTPVAANTTTNATVTSRRGAMGYWKEMDVQGGSGTDPSLDPNHHLVLPSAATAAPSSPPSSPQQQRQQPTSRRGAMGYWKDNDNFFDADNHIEIPHSNVNAPSASSVPIFPQQKQKHQQRTNSVDRYYHQLQDYILTLPAHAKSVTTILQAEYNTLDKALELQQYYASRPGLVEYTVHKELPRMDYTLTDSDTGDVITDKAVIAEQFLRHSNSLCARCANQSLLADLLLVWTGQDRVVRPQYMATAVATHCRFRVDVSSALTEVTATFDLSLPGERGRWKVAELKVMILFQCPPLHHDNNNENDPQQRPYVEYRLADIRVTATPDDADWMLRLDECARLLDMLHDSREASVELPSPPLPENVPNFRDVFLQSQNRLQATAVDAVDGIKSAWQDFDAATGLGSKLKQLPTLLPDAAVWEAAAEEEERLLRMEGQKNQQPRPQQQQRPASILGGLVRSLAQSVLPDEDPSLYHDWQAATPAAASRGPQLYNQQTPPYLAKPAVGAAPQLYFTNVDDHNTQSMTTMTTTTTTNPSLSDSRSKGRSAQPGIPRLYNKETPPTKAKPGVTAAPQLDNVHDDQPKTKPSVVEPVVEDGWDDYDDDVGSSDVDAVAADHVPAEAVAVPPRTAVTLTVLTLEDPLKNWVYDSVTDIIPTRKRWVNPRPGSRELSSVTLV